MYMNMNIEKIKDFSKQNKHVGKLFLLISVVYIILAITLFMNNPYKIITKYGALSIITSLFGAFIILMLYFFIKRKHELYKPDDANSPTIISHLAKIVWYFFTLGIVGFIIFGIVYFFKNMPTLANTILYLLNILIIVGVITILYSFIKPLIYKSKIPEVKLIIDILSYIPLTIINFIKFILTQYKITTKPVWILFCIEILLIILYIFLPKLFDKIIKHDGLLLLSNPTSLRNENIIGNFEILNKNIKKDKYNYNYAISCWIYLNAIPPSTNQSYDENMTILSYGGNPNIYYNGESELVISAKIGNENKIIYKTKNIPYQKWFNLIINHQGGTMDIFMNNNLLLSVKNVVPYMSHDNIIVGNKNGIYGFISNVNYFKNVITKDKMSWIYKTTK